MIEQGHQYEGQLEEPEDDWFDDEDGECKCRECHPLTAKCPRCGKSKLAAKFEICCM